ncbi:MAG: sporulation integral membrane protein YtvI [Oscillospiraceae bacterium]
MNNDKKIKLIVSTLYIVTIIGIAAFGFRIILPCLMPFIIGFFVAYLLRPMITFLYLKLKFNKSIGTILSIILFYTVIGVSLWLIILFMATQIADFAENLPNIYENYFLPSINQLSNYSIDIISRLSPEIANTVDKITALILSDLTSIVSAISGKTIKIITDFSKNLPLFAIATIFTFVSSILISKDYDEIVLFLKRQIPIKQIPIFNGIKHFLKGKIVKFIRAYFIIMLITFCELFIGLSFLRVENSLAIAIIIAILDIMPILGSGIALVPWGCFALVKGQVPFGIGIFLIYFIISFVRTFLEPKIVGDQIGLHPLATIIAMFCGIKLMGFAGIIIAPLLLLTIKYLNDNKIINLYH